MSVQDILNDLAEEVVPNTMSAIYATLGIAPTMEDAEALSEWLRDRFRARVEDTAGW